MKNQTFEEFLQEQFVALNEIGGMPITKDNCEDLFDSWLSNLEGEDYIKWGELFGQLNYIKGKDSILNKF